MEELCGIFEKLRAFQIRSGKLRGAFARESTEKNESNTGPFSTIEGLYPFLIYPKKEECIQVIVDALDYLINDCKNNDNLVRIHPEYPDAEKQELYVDSNAYGLFIFTMGRSLLLNYRNYFPVGKQKMVDSINEIIAGIIRHIDSSKIGPRKKEYGWPLIKQENLPSRTYSTALAVLGLNSCEDEDFDRSGIAEGRKLVEYGVNHLLSGQNVKTGSRNYGGWAFAPLLGSKHSNGHRTSPNPNITAEVCFTLGHITRNPWKPEGSAAESYYDRVKSSIGLGIDYILRKAKKETLVNINETVEYISKNNEIKQHQFTHPFSMVLPGVLITSRISIASDFMETMERKISEEVGKREVFRDWKIFDFSDLTIAQTYYYALLYGIEGLLDKFAKDGEIARCLIEGSTEQCVDVKRYKEDYMRSQIEDLVHYLKIPDLSAVGNALEEFKNLDEDFLKEIKTGTILDNMNYSYELIKESAQWATIKLQQILPPRDVAQRICLVLCGSVGRLEASESSDADFYVLFDDLFSGLNAYEKERIMQCSDTVLKSFAYWLKKYRGVNVDGYRDIRSPDYLSKVDPKKTRFPTLFPISSLLGKIGSSSEDVEELKTKRQALICESVPVFNDELFHKLRKKVTSEYEFESYFASHQLPELLLVEVENLYNSYFTRSQKLKQTDDLRTIKIWHMRGLSFIGIISRMDSLSLGKEEITEGIVEKMFREPPVLRVAKLGTIVEEVKPKVLEVIEKYNASLAALNNQPIRNYLRKGKVVDHTEAGFEGIKMDLCRRGVAVEKLLQDIRKEIRRKRESKYGASHTKE